jgi:hypothetical protein
MSANVLLCPGELDQIVKAPWIGRSTKCFRLFIWSWGSDKIERFDSAKNSGIGEELLTLVIRESIQTQVGSRAKLSDEAM